MKENTIKLEIDEDVKDQIIKFLKAQTTSTNISNRLIIGFIGFVIAIFIIFLTGWL